MINPRELNLILLFFSKWRFQGDKKIDIPKIHNTPPPPTIVFLKPLWRSTEKTQSNFRGKV